MSADFEKPAPDVADVPYGPHARQVLDFWHPRGDGPAPLVVYIHGGGFRGGDKSTFPATILKESLETGFAAAAVNYRLSDTVSFPTFMLDAGRAIQFLRHQAADWNIDPDRFAATGGSAGGGISLWLGFHPDLAVPESPDPIARQSSRLTCLGVYNTQCSYSPVFFRENGLEPAANHPFMPPFYGLTYEELDKPEALPVFAAAAPMNWFHAGGPPVFIYYPQSDEPLPPDAHAERTWAPGLEELPPADRIANRAVHHPKMGRIITERLDALGVPCVLHVNVGDRIPAVQAQMVTFFKNHLLTEP